MTLGHFVGEVLFQKSFPCLQNKLYWDLVLSKKKFTLNDGKQNDNNEEEKGEIEQDPEDFIGITIWRLDLVTNTTTSSDTFVQMEHEALKQKLFIFHLNH